MRILTHDGNAVHSACVPRTARGRIPPRLPLRRVRMCVCLVMVECSTIRLETGLSNLRSVWFENTKARISPGLVPPQHFFTLHRPALLIGTRTSNGYCILASLLRCVGMSLKRSDVQSTASLQTSQPSSLRVRPIDCGRLRSPVSSTASRKWFRSAHGTGLNRWGSGWLRRA